MKPRRQSRNLEPPADRETERPAPDQGLGGSGPVPGGHTVVLDRAAAT